MRSSVPEKMRTDDHPAYNDTVLSASEIGPVTEKSLPP